ncbi:SAM-dependent methyltransferase [Streptomyces scopuliridis]|uniref:SAM-dependent methyltransferase n=1 Tax=Streptomyces scopuliridis TaxID=452529 RepID=A0ACD4ZUW1_9ACTN|nr:SAM-dependent methyltransferase [Streptomyces scopuliridis]WSC01719.1 SAM-dependent methyltransferase [Streptomyces scopuliridis]WSC04742.1 SAM-dependent methyltransferase [Streptomyces scopuliridis]
MLVSEFAQRFTKQVVAVATVIGGHSEPRDDFQGGIESIIRLNRDYPLETLEGIEEFSHLVVTWHFHQASPDDVSLHARSPRNNPLWPRTGTFVHRNHRRPNQLAISYPRILRREGHDLHVTDLDAIHGTPIIDLAPYFTDMGPRGEVREPAWPSEMLRKYWHSGTE